MFHECTYIHTYITSRQFPCGVGTYNRAPFRLILTYLTCFFDVHSSCHARSMASVDYSEVPVKEKNLHTPPLEEIVEVLSAGLPATFESVEVSVVDSPDLTQPPFHLTSSGLSGSSKLVEVGGVPYLLPLVQRDKIYDLARLMQHLKRDPGFIIGAGAGPWPYTGVNCEYYDGTWRGRGGAVIKVVVKKRIGEANFISAIRETLKNHYGDKIVGLGGTFLLRKGRGKFHVMPAFSTTPLCSDSDVDNWLHYFEMAAPMNVVGTLITGDPDLDLRVQHFHGWGEHGDGGHYHYDTTPETVEYEGYFALAESIIRVDAPQVTHTVGRD
ncbi:hypothetical protein K1T71_003618 [Dendrolimus kikuchii]|uniref:Uncharacterized protein n=1 Tax=Dendrolimus kikuchii TaxID=765133 RepID=A0ACC1D8C6_9NEOP|nr:hypothetical protein K1T71_003618 [Dendrolimus kikuchii]